MASVMTFTSLKDDMRKYLERGSSSVTDPLVYDQLPALINLAERRIARELKVQGFIVATTTSLTANVSTYAKPDRWRDTVSMSIVTEDSRTPVFARSYEYIRAVELNANGGSGVPEFYADYDYTHWLLSPTPNMDYTLEVLYYELPVLLDDSNQTNWLTEYAPDILLYAALLEATPFLKADERIPVWQQMYDRAAGMLNGEDLAKMLDRASVRKEA